MLVWRSIALIDKWRCKIFYVQSLEKERTMSNKVEHQPVKSNWRGLRKICMGCKLEFDLDGHHSCFPSHSVWAQTNQKFKSLLKSVALELTAGQKVQFCLFYMFHVTTNATVYCQKCPKYVKAGAKHRRLFCFLIRKF